MERKQNITDKSTHAVGALNEQIAMRPMTPEITETNHATNSGNGGDSGRNGGEATHVLTESLPVGPTHLAMDTLALTPHGTLMSERTMASCLAVSTRTVRRMVQRGQLPNGIKLGSRRVWVAAKVIEYFGKQSDQLAQEARRVVQRYKAAI